MIPPALFFFLNIVLSIQGLLCFHTSFGIICSSSVKNAMGILIGIALNFVLGSMVILTIIILLIHEHDISFHLCLQFLSSVYYSFLSTGVLLLS